MLHLIFSVPCLYVLVRFVALLPWPLGAKVALGAVMLVASQYHLWCRLSSGSVFSPEFPCPVVLAFNWAFGAILLLAMFQLAIDLGSLALSAVRSGTATPTTLRYAAAGLAAVLAAVGVAQAARVPPVRELTVEVAGLPPAFDGYRRRCQTFAAKPLADGGGWTLSPAQLCLPSCQCCASARSFAGIYVVCMPLGSQTGKELGASRPCHVL